MRTFIKGDLFSYIAKTRNLTFIEVLSVIKNELGIKNYYEYRIKRSIFGGFYERIKFKDNSVETRIYDKSLLDNYQKVYSLQFFHDHISFDTQKRFGIGYDLESQRFTIPIYNPMGELIGVKGRASWTIQESESKYLYLVPTAKSNTLYGYSENYKYLVNNDIYIGEAEKFVMQLYSYGIYNAVAIAGNTLSNEQCKLLLSLSPTKIIFMLDSGLDKNITEKNIELLRKYTKMKEIKIYWWNWELDIIPNKCSPSDFGKGIFNLCLENVEVIE